MKARYRIRVVPAPYTRLSQPRPGHPVILDGRRLSSFRIERRTWFVWREIDSATSWENAQLFLSACVRTARLKTRVLKTFDRHGEEIT